MVAFPQVSHFRHPGSPVVQQCVVGVNIFLDRVIAAEVEAEIRAAETKSSSSRTSEPVTYAVDVLLCSLGHKAMEREKLALAQKLWAAGIATDIIHDRGLVCITRMGLKVIIVLLKVICCVLRSHTF